MPSFGQRSRNRIATLRNELRAVLEESIEFTDFTVICGHRNEEAQTLAFDSGYSTVKWPHSKHNSKISRAVDIAPWHRDKPHIRWKEEREFIFLAGVVMGIAFRMDVRLRWGGDWDGDFDQSDQTFMDIGHFEIVDG